MSVGWAQLVVLLFLLFFLFGDVRGKFNELSEGVKSFRNTFSSQSSDVTSHKDQDSKKDIGQNEAGNGSTKRSM